MKNHWGEKPLHHNTLWGKQLFLPSVAQYSKTTMKLPKGTALQIKSKRFSIQPLSNFKINHAIDNA